MRQLVFVHGRSQQHKDAVALKQEWIQSWREGLAKTGLDLPIAEADIRFPYYGDTLYDLVAKSDEVADVVVKGAATGDPDQEQFVADVIQEIAAAKGIDAAAINDVLPPDVVLERGVLNWQWVHAILKVIDRRVPFGSGSSIALFTADVYAYLNNPGIRDRIETGARDAFKAGGEMVVVAHSLGTIVAYNLLRRDGGAGNWHVPLFVTVGSPLAITKIRSALRPLTFPSCATSWFNALDPGDVVALYPLDAHSFATLQPPIENKTDVVNQTPNQHGIAGYLNDPVVAKRIYDALVV
jgi:hypothetical protein